MSAMERCSLIFERLSRTEGRPNVERLRSRRPTEAYTVSLFPPIDPVAKRSRQGLSVSYCWQNEREQIVDFSISATIWECPL